MLSLTPQPHLNPLSKHLGLHGPAILVLCHNLRCGQPVQYRLDGRTGVLESDAFQSAGAGRAPPGPVPGGRRADGVPLPVQRQLHRHAAEGGSTVRGGGCGAGHLAAGYAVHVPQPGQWCSLAAPGHRGGHGRCPAGAGAGPVPSGLPAAEAAGAAVTEANARFWRDACHALISSET